ncbi:hypothetical protein E4P82_16190 [Candidatus Competibacter phosphatis]|uniref:Uncharacterized protein n=1 Tax=Candidatus Competibacter phosphatis TaxID=221280 RepID=A0ABX1TR73_9GAMM|nr:hypothetical protein [Candidatus Competibacter phosphatis]NMQ20598.1 hypothetical protein [Candidatus Competibacter phosphatis]
MLYETTQSSRASTQSNLIVFLNHEDSRCNFASDRERKEKKVLTDIEIFARPFELEMIKDKILDQIKQEIKESFKQNNLKSLKVSPIGHVLFPKKGTI